jgi:phenylpyruvate tautomerase PptA (4-oxalocrotonate tautomerase family)
MPTVIVYWSPGRTDEQKQRVSRRIAEALVEEGNARIEDVLIIFQHIEPGNSARGPDLLNSSAPPSDSQKPDGEDWEKTHGA